MKQLLKSLRNAPLLNSLVRQMLRGMHRRWTSFYHWITLHWPVSGNVKIEVPGGSYQVLSKGDDYIAKAAFFNIDYEVGTDRFVAMAVKRCSCLLDVGGNTGHFSLAACAMQPKLVAYAFEPVPSIFNRLKQNAALNPFQIHPQQLALSDAEGTLSLFVPKSEISYSASSNADFHQTDVAEVSIRATTMDQFVKENQLRPDFIKIDVEWHELSVLKGAVGTLATCSPVLVIEVLFAEIEAYKNPALKGKLRTDHAQQIEAFMREQGYTFYKPLPDGLMRIDSLELNYDERNYVFSKHKSSRQFISYHESDVLYSQVMGL
ncbi:MAG: FkbM family methyltransferase [Chitinophagales bacterium]